MARPMLLPQPNFVSEDSFNKVMKHQSTFEISLESAVALDFTKEQSLTSSGLSQSEIRAAPRLRSNADDGITQKERLEASWHDFFLDPTNWLDYRPDKKNSRYPDFRHKASKKVLWLNNYFKPAWVDSQLAKWDDEMRQRLGTTSTSGNDLGHCRLRMYEQDLSVRTFSRRCEEIELTEAVNALDHLVQRGCYIDCFLFYKILKRCMAQKDLFCGKLVDALTVKSGYVSNTFLANHIICMYASHGKLEEALDVFTRVPVPDAYMWSSIILGYAKQGQPKRAVELYRHMRESTVKPDNRVFVAVLKACASAGDLNFGKDVHDDILRSLSEPDMFVGSCLVTMYAKCGSLVDARKVFNSLPTKNVVTWNAMFAGYTQHGLGQEALRLYASMQQEGLTSANHVSFLSLLQACGSVGALHQGKKIHSEIQERGLEADVVVGTSLIDMYAKCSSLEDARRVFDSLPTKDVVTWNAMLAGYAQHGLGQEALTLYTNMQQEGIAPADHFSFACLLQACASLGALAQGKDIHCQIKQRGLEANVVVGTSLVNMYAKCGSLSEARKVFDRLPTRDVVTWTSLLNGYAQHSDVQTAIQFFQHMLQQGIEPDPATFTCLIVACSHGGLVDEGQQYLKMMVEDHGIALNGHHRACIVDLLGRSGRLAEAEKMLQTMPFDIDTAGWISLLTACRSHGDVERGRRCFDLLVTWEPENAVPYVLLGNIYANAGMWKDVDLIERLRKAAGAKKMAAKACIEVKRKVHEFTVGEATSDISSKLSSMDWRVKQEGGHMPHTEVVLKRVSHQDKQDALCGHAEKLALAYGLLNTPHGTTLLVTKNLRMCNDCHSSTKIMSRLEKRDIIVRDAHRVHRFVDGSCSCGDRH